MSLHGHNARGKRSPTYRSWAMMVARCTNPRVDNYAFYGGRGIKVCDRWRDFASFLADMGERPSLAHSLDRWPNRDGDYEPGNARWATSKEQARNTKSNRPVVRSDGKAYDSMVAAADDVMCTRNDIYAACSGRQKTLRGFGWRYADV